MKTDCLLRPKNHIKLDPLTTTPNIGELKQLYLEVQKTRNCSIELPWVVDLVRFSLEVRINLGTQEAIWTLYQGDGVHSHLAWSAPFTDLNLLREVLAISIAEIVLEHEQEKARKNPKQNFDPRVNRGSSSAQNPYLSGDLDDGLPDHSYRNAENSLASFAGVVSERVTKGEQNTKTGKGKKGDQQIPGVAQETINKAEQSINKAEQSINKAEQSIGKAEKSIDKAASSITKAEKSINKAEQVIETMSETTALASTILHSVAKKSVSEMVNESKNGNGSKDKNGTEQNKTTVTPATAQSVPYQYGYPIPVVYPVGMAPVLTAGGVPIVTPTTAPTNNPSASDNDAKPSSILLAKTDEKLLDKQTKFLIGQFLVDSGLVPKNTLDTALKLQKMIAGNVINLDQAIETIGRVHFRNGNFDIVQLMRNSTTSGNKVNNSDYPLIGQLLVKSGVLDDATLEASLKMQELVRGGSMSKEKAVEILNKEFVASGKAKTNTAKAEQAKEHNIVNLLIEASILTAEDKKVAQNVQKQFGGKIGEILVSAHKLSKTTYQAAFDCETLISQGKLKLEETMIALNFCERSRVNLSDAFQELGFKITA